MSLPRTAPLATFTAAPLVTFAQQDAGLTTNRATREVEGLIVPFGPAGFTAAGLLTFRPGSLSWHPDVRRVKLLVEHDQVRSVGHAVELREVTEPVPGIWGRFRVAEGPEGDRVLDEVEDGRRDGFSVGCQLDAATHDRLTRARGGQAVAGSGQLRETSTVSIPAFDDARGQLVTASGLGGLTTMTTPQPGQPGAPDPAAPAPASPEPAAPAPAPTTPPTPAPTDPGAPQGQAPVTPAAAALTTGTGSGPRSVRAAAGAHHVVTAEPSIYTFDGAGHSLMRDAWAARVNGDHEAMQRINRFNAQLADGNAMATALLVTASGAYAAGSGALTTAAPGDPIPSPADRGDAGIPASFLPQRTDQFRQAVDAGRPLVSRLPSIRLTNATPFVIPREGEFSGVGPHTEGTPHRAPGTLTLGDGVAVPQAYSGYYELTRELVDASNPAIDRIALRAMLRDYRRETEQLAVDTIETVAPTIGSVNTAMELRAALVGFVDDDGFGADFVAASKTALAALYADVDTTGRPMIATAGNAPTATSGRAGYTGAGIDGTEIVRVPRITAGRAYGIRSEGILWGESNVQQFRFEEVQGPGLIALALWAYAVCAILDADDILGVDVDAIV